MTLFKNGINKKDMKNRKCFVIVSTQQKNWRLTAHNMEERVESGRFNLIHGRFHDDKFEAVSMRNVLDGDETPFERWEKLRLAILSCGTVYAARGHEYDKECRRMVRFARLMLKRVIKESWEEQI